MGSLVLRQWRLDLEEYDSQVSSCADFINCLRKAEQDSSVNGGPAILVDQPDTGGGGVVLSVPVKLSLQNGANSLTFGSGQSSKLTN